MAHRDTPSSGADNLAHRRVAKHDTIALYAARLLDRAEATGELEPTTLRMYRTALGALGEIGQMPLAQVTAVGIRDWWPSVRRNRTAVRSLLSKVLARASRDGLVVGSPFKDAEVKRPKQITEVDPLTVAQVERLAGVARRPRDRAMILLMAYGGFRPSEVGALRDHDIDFEACRVNVRQHITRDGGKRAGSKTTAGRRSVFVERGVIGEIRRLIETGGVAPDGRIFFTDGWKPKLFGYLYAERINEIVKTAAKATGISATSKTLRHTAASLWITVLHADPVSVQRQLGHSDVRVTLGTYGHLFEYGGQSLAEGMRALREKNRRQQKSP